ncbi:MAG: DUF2179 domain-containing protein [Calditrichaeota bacterium]|nr:DUF2179 domain-containing protein [Calditrichota bacterium]RQW04705.1 MAG: DUF2179 domain-containing protein [Calditrichota bacterium]
MNSDLFAWVILPLFIFLARVVDVSFGTLRIVYTAKGRRFIAPALGFIEIMIWLLAIGQIFKNLNNIACYIAYAGGFSMGNFAGIWIESKLALGNQVLRIITGRDATELITRMRKDGFGLTVVDAQGIQGPVKLIFTVIKRKNLSEVIRLVHEYNPKAFYSVEDVRFVSEGIFPVPIPHHWGFFRGFDRKGK